MRQRVTVVLVARNGADYLERTLSALAAQSRRPDSVIAVDAGSSDKTAELLAASGPTQLVTAPAKTSFGFGIGVGMRGEAPAETDDDWLWFLAHDSAPAPRALQQLLAAVEIAPSVGIAGPKLMRWDKPDVIAEFGESMTQLGASMALVENELDQAQHDVSDDVLGVAATGMFVRRSLWSRIGGFDPGLPTVDAGLDFSIRARLAGFRVVLVPGAKVSTAGGPESFGRKSVSVVRQVRASRSAQLHRRLVYAPGPMLALHWLSLIPLAIIRSMWQLLAKRPGAIPGEFAAACTTAFGAGSVVTARRNLRRNRTVGWGAIVPLRLPWGEVRERRAQEREAFVTATAHPRQSRIGFGAGGGFFVVALAAVAGVVAFGPLLGARAVTGGGLLPLDPHVSALWGRIGVGWRDIGTGFVGPADPFAAVLAFFGTITWWAPSLIVVLLYFVALPLAAAGAWFAARQISRRAVAPVAAAALWAIAPPFLASLTTGHLGSSLAHVLLPWFALALLNAARSWPASAGAALLMAAVAASAPVLTPVLLISWIAWMITHPRSLHRLIAVPVPTIALFLPLVIEQLQRGNPLGLLADPGVPFGGATGLPWKLALGGPGDGLNGWSSTLESLWQSGSSAPIVLAALFAPVVVIAMIALFVPGSVRALPCLVIALVGFAVAVASSRIEVSTIGADTVAIWPGSGLSIFWLGLVGLVVVTLDALGRVSVASAALAIAVSIAIALPMLAASYTGLSDIAPSSGRIVAAVVAAESQSNPRIGTLVITPEDPAEGSNADDAVSVTLQRGLGATLDDQSTLAATAASTSKSDERLAVLAGNLASHTGFDESAQIDELYIGFVVLGDAEAGNEKSDAVHKRVEQALNGNERLTPVGESANGLLWRVSALPTTAPADDVGNTDTALGAMIVFTQGAVFFITVLLAIPTSRRRRKVRTNASSLEDPATTFDEEENA